MELIEYKDVCVGYSKERNVLENVTFSVKQGTITAMLGPNGSGKSTLMSTMNKLFKASSGQIFIEGVDINRMSVKEVASRIAFVPQVTSTGFAFGVREAILWGRAPYITYLPTKNDYRIVDEVIERLKIEHLRDKSFNEISGGEKQMVLVARAIAQQAPIILMDEPATYLDLKNQSKILNVIKEINSESKVTFIVTLHDPNHAMFLADNIMFIKNKRAKLGSVADMMTEENLAELYGVRCEIVENENEKNIIVRYQKS